MMHASQKMRQNADVFRWFYFCFARFYHVFSLPGPVARTIFDINLTHRIHGAILRAILRAMAELHRVSTPKFVGRNIAAVELRPTSATLRTADFFLYPPYAAFRAIM